MLTAMAAAFAGRADEPPTLPDALPPLDDTLVPAAPVQFFAQMRVRGDVDDDRTFARASGVVVGTSITGRVGVEGALPGLDGASLVVIAGDGGRVGQPGGAPALVAPAALTFLYQAELALPFSIAGVPAALDVGRMPVVIADGRLVGDEPFDERGRTLDGFRVRAHPAITDVSVGAFWLDSNNLAAPISGVIVVDAAIRPSDALDLDAYGFVHRDGLEALTIPTAGARVDAALWSWLRLHGGADVQAPLRDGSTAFASAGRSGHAEIGGRASGAVLADAPSLFVDAGGEVTAGDAVLGRVFRAPAPTQHDALGLLDLVARDNTWATRLSLGAVDTRGLSLAVTGSLVGIVDAGGPLVDTSFAPLIGRRAGVGGVALYEVDGALDLPLGKGVGLAVGYGLAVPGRALANEVPAQRLLVSLHGSIGEAAQPAL
jgi:hypothetical protein